MALIWQEETFEYFILRGAYYLLHKLMCQFDMRNVLELGGPLLRFLHPYTPVV